MIGIKGIVQEKGGFAMGKIVLTFICLLFVFSVSAEDLGYYRVHSLKEGMSADEIMQIMYHNKYSLFAHDYSSTNEVLYVDSGGFTRKKSATRQRLIKGGEDGISYKDLVEVTYPTKVKGLAILTWTYEDPEKDQNVWLWVPSLKKVRKISASQDDDAFMGSDLTVEEVSTRRFEDEEYTLLGEKKFEGYAFEHNGEVKYKGNDCFVIECTPLKPHWYYAKRIVWVDKETGGGIFEEYYDKNGQLFKTLFREWVFMDVEGKKYPTQLALECKDLRTGHRTDIFLDNIVYDRQINEQVFTVKSLMRTKW
ncbi:MAG: outer membrane lipoprotein-sorting protein [Candidatus Omnitrophica bacterium]|nr:outer membrane lipoprotein-sorting protein [Candidatus Omnitrophota bacterium]MBD3268891.1 outer membrane lipoprotein-sorting protein [Candidatus Omnitrophota bacterium]